MAERRIGDVKVRLGKLFAEGGPPDVQGSVTSNLAYILALEHGHSSQAPSGMVRPNLKRIAALAKGELERALGLTEDPGEALGMAITGSVMAALYVVAEATPVDEGTAKGSWVGRWPGGEVHGHELFAGGPRELKPGSGGGL